MSSYLLQQESPLESPNKLTTSSPRSTPLLGLPNGLHGVKNGLLLAGSNGLHLNGHVPPYSTWNGGTLERYNKHPSGTEPGSLTVRDRDGDEVQSVKSEIGPRSKRHRHNGHSHSHRSPNHRSQSHRSTRGHQTRELTSPLSTTVSLASPNLPPDNRPNHEVIEVQILPQDDGWADNATAVTGNTSVASGSMEDVSRIGAGDPGRDLFSDPHHLAQDWAFRCQRYMGSIVSAILALFGFLSPIAMVLLPRLQIVPIPSEQLKCGAECEGLLISFTFKLLLLALGTWAVFWRTPRATMPRIFFLRTLVLILVFVLTFAYCLFYGVRVVEQQDQLSYQAIVVFALSLVDALLFVHCAAVLLLEIRQIPPRYYLHVVRSPDGASKGYPIGQLSIQRAAVWLLDRYYTDFPIYNPYLDRLPSKRSQSKLHQSNSASFKFYDVDGTNNGGGMTNSRSVMPVRRRDSSHNERFYEEHEYERRLKKRRARLITAAEEAFTHIRRMHEEQGPGVPMDPYEAAQAVFPSMARPLQKYLRITRQQPRHSVETILQHLALCLSHDMSARAFVEKFLVASPVLQSDKEHIPVQTWSLICDVLLSRGIEHNTVFQLRQNDVSLLCRISKLPHYNITEEIIDPKCNKFVLRLSSETSV